MAADRAAGDRRDAERRSARASPFRSPRTSSSGSPRRSAGGLRAARRSPTGSAIRVGLDRSEFGGDLLDIAGVGVAENVHHPEWALLGGYFDQRLNVDVTALDQPAAPDAIGVYVRVRRGRPTEGRDDERGQRQRLGGNGRTVTPRPRQGAGSVPSGCSRSRHAWSVVSGGHMVDQRGAEMSTAGRGGAACARSLIPRSIFWLITKLISSTGSTSKPDHRRVYS
jgi:hypothetical protein